MKLNKKLTKNLFKGIFSIFCTFYLVLMISCKSGSITSSSSSNDLNNQNKIEENASGIPNIQDARDDQGIPNGEDKGNANENTHQMSLTQPAKQKVDILMVIDKSLSMRENHKAFLESSHFQNLFSGPLQLLDWQMGFVNTYAGSIYHHLDYLEDNNGIITMSKGDHIQVLTQEFSTSHNLTEIFKNTIHQGTQTLNKSYDTEEPLGSIINTIQLPENSDLFRSDAALVIIIMSDEDERSTGDSEATMPAEVIRVIRNILGQSKQFSAYSIIIPPGDQQCLNAERAATTILSENKTWVPPQEAEGPPCPKPYRPGYWLKEKYSDNGGGSYGYSATELAHLTNGITTSICNENYNSIISNIKEKFTANRISNKIQLKHTDIIENTINVTFTPSTNAPSWEFNSQENTITLSTIPTEGTTIQISYRYK